MTRTRFILLAAVIVAVVVAGTVGAASGSSRTATEAKTPTLRLAKTDLGTILVDKRGRTLYAFGHDLKNRSRCHGQCAANWPPAKAPAKPTVAKGIKKSKLKVIKRGDGSRQLSFNGHPLYRFIADSGPGTTSGQNVTAFGGTWHVLSKRGATVTKAPSSAPAPGGY